MRVAKSAGFCVVSILTLGVVQSMAFAETDAPNHVILGPGVIASPGTARGLCGTSLLHSDGQYDASIGWQYGGVQTPAYGAFAECYAGTWDVCAAVLDLTRTDGSLPSSTLDAYLWSDDGAAPGNVLCIVTGADPGPVAFWPQFSRHEIPFPSGCCVEGTWWVGYWPHWPGSTARWYTMADEAGVSGCPFTNIAPGIGYPTGWHDVSVVFGPINSIGIGAAVLPCSPTSVTHSTWGAMKALY